MMMIYIDRDVVHNDIDVIKGDTHRKEFFLNLKRKEEEET